MYDEYPNFDRSFDHAPQLCGHFNKLFASFNSPLQKLTSTLKTSKVKGIAWPLQNQASKGKTLKTVLMKVTSSSKTESPNNFQFFDFFKIVNDHKGSSKIVDYETRTN